MKLSTNSDRPLLIDLFCKQGGAGMGYYQAGFDVIGVDIDPQPRYPFEFIQGDVFEVWDRLPHDKVSAYHASPPCQLFCAFAHMANETANQIPHTRQLLQSTGKPYVIENVPGSPLVNPLMLCGTMFSLRVIRHRHFETNPAIWFPPFACHHWGKVAHHHLRVNGKRVTSSFEHGDFVSIAGNGFKVNDACQAMGIDWMTQDGLREAIPPAYTKFIGSQLLKAIQE